MATWGCTTPTTADHQASEAPGAFVNVNGHRLWYRRSGHGASLVIVPGGPGVSHAPYSQLERLADSFEVVLFDAYGRGQSERASHPDGYSFNGDVEDVEQLRAALGLPTIAIYGHSYGGMVAQAYALRYPQHVNRLILSDTLDSADAWQRGNIGTWVHDVQQQFPDAWAEMQRLRVNGAVSCDASIQQVESRIPATLSYFFDPAHAKGVPMDANPDVYCQLAGRDADFVLGGDLATLDFRPDLPALTMPVLVLEGRFDRAAPPAFEVELNALIPHSRLVMFEQSGHFPFIEEPQQHDAVVRDFLRGAN